MRSRYLATAALIFCVSATAAYADPVMGSFGLGDYGISAFQSDGITPALTLATATTFTLSTIGTSNGFVSTGALGNFSPASGNLLTISTLNLNDLLAFTFTGALGTFQADSSNYTAFVGPLTDTVQGNGGGQGSETVYEYGTFTPNAELSAFGPDSMLVTLSLTRTGESFSLSGTAAAPAMPVTGVPEPVTLALLGVGLLGLGGMRRRNKTLSTI